MPEQLTGNLADSYCCSADIYNQITALYLCRAVDCIFSEKKMRTDIYTLAGVKAELVNLICLQYIEKLLQTERISKKHAELLTKRFSVGCTGKQK